MPLMSALGLQLGSTANGEETHGARGLPPARARFKPAAGVPSLDGQCIARDTSHTSGNARQKSGASAQAASRQQNADAAGWAARSQARHATSAARVSREKQ